MITTLTRFILAEEKEFPGATGELSDLLASIGLAVKVISRLVATASIEGLYGSTGEENIQGEVVQKLDREADKILIDLLSSSGHFGSVVSEEQDDVVETLQGSEKAKYVVAFDPLDGSSNIGTNIPVGTIFIVFRNKHSAHSKPAGVRNYFQSGQDIVAAGYSVYGAMTSLVYSCGRGVHGFTLDPSIGEFVLTEKNIRTPEQGKYYSVNEGYTSLWDEKTKACVRYFRSNENPSGKAYGTRYVGSLVSDFDRTLRRGGIYMHPASKDRESGKLRLLYECLPLAYVIHQAGGRAWDGEQDIIHVTPDDIHQRSPFMVGGQNEIAWVERLMGDGGNT